MSFELILASDSVATITPACVVGGQLFVSSVVRKGSSTKVVPAVVVEGGLKQIPCGVASANVSPVANCDSLSTNVIDRGELLQDLRPFPNPVSDRLYLPDYHGFYDFWDVRGTRVSSGTWTGSLSIGQLPSGLYLLRTEDGRVSRILLHSRQ